MTGRGRDLGPAQPAGWGRWERVRPAAGPPGFGALAACACACALV